MSCAVLANAQSQVTISPTALAAATSGTPYLQLLTATGGSGAPYTWSAVLAGNGAQLPSWLTLTSVSTTTATLSGTPPTNGTLSIAVTAKDHLGVSSSPLTLNLPINFAGTVFDGILGNLPAGMAIINLSAASSAPLDGGNGANDSFNANGGTQTQWSFPFNSEGQLLEYTLPPGTYTMRVIDAADAAAIFPNLTAGQQSSMWSAWTYNTPWTTEFLAFDSSAASNNSQTQLFSVAAGSPGPLNPNGAAQAYADAVNGYTNTNNAVIPPFDNNIALTYRNATPQKTVTLPLTGTGAETLIFSLPDSVVTDNAGGVSILIAPFTSYPSITTTSLSNGQVGVAYTPTPMNASGGNGTYTWTATGLPTGLTVSTSGILSGTPTVTGSFPSVFFTVTDPVSGLSFTQTTPFHMTMGAPSPALTITTTSIPQGEMGVQYSTPIVATGGFGSLTWSISSGPLVISSTTGVLSSDGDLSGGNGSQFTVTVTDAAGDTFTSPTYTLLVDGPVTISTSALNSAAVGESWATTFTASGGTTFYLWSATGLPSWLTMSPFGVLSGVPTTPTAPGTISFSVKVTDTAGGTNTVLFNLLVNMPLGYLVENAHGGGLLFAPGDGSAISLQAGTNANDVVEDAGGNAVVASGTGLFRITPFGGSVSTVATTPSGSSWIAVAVDAFGYLIVGDNVAHEIWRVSPDGVSSTMVTSYTVTTPTQREDVKILVDVHGNYIVAEDNGGAVQVFNITPAGAVTPLTLTGASPKSVNGLAFDPNGNYQLLDSTNEALYRITPSGAVTAIDIGLSGNPGGLAINPLTGLAYTASVGQVDQILSAGLTPLSSSGSVESPEGLATLTEDFPSTVDATYPLAYFRLETVAGSSEVNGAYSYNLTGSGGAATISNPGAPIGIPANNGAVLDGQTGEITTSLTGQIATAGSMMAWVKLAALPSTSSSGFSYIAGESAQANDFDLQFNNFNVLGFYTTCCGSSLPYTPDPTTLVGQWHMIVATFDAVAGTRAIYWDGSLVANDNCPSCSSYINKTGAFWIGNTSNFSNFGNRNFPGAIDEVGVWNYALTAPQVYRMYASRPAASTGITTSISPTSAPYQSPTAITITGQDYSASCDGCTTVWFTPQGGPTTILTPSPQTQPGSTTVNVTIPAQQLGIPGPASVAVARQGIPSNAIPFTVLGPPALSVTPVGPTLVGGQTFQPYSVGLTASGGTGNFSWSITSQSEGLNLALSASTGPNTTLFGTPTAASTGDPWVVNVLLTDTASHLTLQKTYSVFIAPLAPQGAPPVNITAFVLNQDDSLASVTSANTSSLVAGSSCNACYDMVHDSAGNLIVAAGSQLKRFTATGNQMTPVTAPGYTDLFGVAIDSSGNYIVTDGAAHKVLRISPVSPFAVQVVASYQAYLYSPDPSDAYVRIDSSGNYIVADDNNLEESPQGPLFLFSITPAGVITPIPITPTQGGTPQSTRGLTFDASGNYVNVDPHNHTIFTIAPAGAPNAGASSPLFTDPNAFLSIPEGIYFDSFSGLFYVVDVNNHALYTLTQDGTLLTEIASGTAFAGGPNTVVVEDAASSLSFTPAAPVLPAGQTNQLYAQALTASGGSGNYSWAILNQSTGLNLALSPATGVTVSLTGTPTVVNTAGALTVTVQLTDTSTLATVSQTYSISVSQGQPPAPGSWTISANFADGGTLTGSFVVDPLTSAVSTWNLVTTTGSTLAGFTYTPSSSSASYSTASSNVCAPPCLQFISNQTFPDGDTPQNQVLDLSFVGSLSSGGTLNLYTDNTNDTASHECLDCNPSRLFSSGSAVAVGVPYGVQPSATNAYVLNQNNALFEVTNGGVTPLVNGSGCYGCLDMARDAAGDLIVPSGFQLEGYTPAGTQLSGFPLNTTQDTSFYASVAIDASGNYIVADTGLNEILRIAPPVNGTPQTPQVVASFTGHGDAYVRVDSAGNYILTTDNSSSTPTAVSLFRITPAGGVTTIPITPAGTSAAPGSTGGLTFDASGNYVNIDWKNRVVSTIAPYGASNAGTSTPLFTDPNNYLRLPVGINRDPLSGDYFLVDTTNNAVYTLSPDGSVLSQIASSESLAQPTAVVVADAVPPGTTDYVLQNNYSVVPIGPGSTVSCPSNICPTGFPNDIALDASDNFIVASVSALAKITRAGLSSVISTPPSGSQWVSAAVDSSGYFIVADNALNRVVRISPTGTVVPVASFPVLNNDELEDAFVRIDSQGNYIVAEDSASVLRMFRISTSGTVTPITLTGTVPGSVGGFTIDASGHYVIVDYINDIIDTITPAGVGSVLFSNSNATLHEPRGIYYDPVNSNFLVAGISTGTLYSLTANGTQLTVVENGLTSPVAVVSIPFGITTTSLPAGTQGQTYAPVTLTATGGSGSYSWLATGLPSGMNLSTGGVLSGIPGASGPFTVSVTVTDTASSHTAMSNLSLTIATGSVSPPSPPTPPVTPPLSITTSSLPNGTVGLPYGPAGMTASGGTGGYSWSIIGLPSGLGMSTAGVVSGTPTAPGTFPVTITVTNAGLLAQQSYSITIGSAALTLNGPASLGVFAPSTTVSGTYSAAGGIAPYKWSATGLPTGLTINPSLGSIGGAVTQPGTYNFVVQVSDSQPVSTSLNGSVSILGITTTALPDSSNKVPYSQALGAAGGNGSYTWALTGALPPGLGLSGSGVLSGTPALAGTPASTQAFTFGVSVTSAGVTVSATLSLNVTLLPQPLTIPGGGDSPVALASGPVQVGYSQALQAAGGTPPYSWSVLAGSLPDGVGLSTSGTVSGTPTRIGSFGFTAHATDASGGSASAGFTIAITAPALTITTVSPLPNGIAGTSYPPQALTASGGVGPYTFQMSGTLPAGLSVSDGVISGLPTAAGNASFTVTATDSTLPAPLTASTDLEIPVGPPHTDLVLSQTALSFSFNAGAPALPSGPSSARVTVASNGSQELGYSFNLTPAASWLDVTADGTTPGGISVALDPKALSLSPGIVNTSIVVTCVTPAAASQPSPCAGNTQTITVTLKVISAPPLLSVGPGVLSFSAQTSSPQTSVQSLVVQNAGGGTIAVNSITAASGFVSFSGVPSTIPASSSAYVNVSVNSAGLAAGFYQSTILVDTSAGSANVPVTLFVSPNPTMALNPSGTQFQMVAGASPGNSSGSFRVDVSSASPVSWHATVLPGANWLQLTNTSVSSSSAAPGTVSYSINSAAATLAPQAYYGTIQVTSGTLANSPQFFLVVLNVVAAPSAVQPDPEPAGLLFISNGTSALPSQTVQVFASSTAPVNYLASSDSSWLSVTTGTSTASIGSPGSSSVSVNAAGLLPGLYYGGVSYQFAGSGFSTSVRTVNVTLIVEGSGAARSDRTLAIPQQQTATCTPSQLVPTQTGLVNAFAQPASWPTPLNVLLTDDCANPITAGQIVATFSNGDAPLQLSRTDATSGNYSATWTPRNASTQITISARATATGFPAAIQQITGQVTPKSTPLLTPNGTLNAFSPVVGAAIAPGTIIQIYGSNLAGQAGTASAIPLPNKINSTSVLIGGLQAPLYYVSPGQINAQVPFELSAGSQYQVIVNANGALSTPNPIQLSPDAPGIAVFTAGQVIAQHLDGSLVQETSPAAPGEIIVFYAAGLGQTNQTIDSGTASPSGNLAEPLDTPTLTVGGIPVTNILFAGLTPTLVGLYQVDFQVPATAPNGDLQMILTQATGDSNTTVLPVHN